MRIHATKASKDKGTQTYTAHRHKDGSYKLFPRGSNLIAKAKVVHSLEDAIEWLQANEGWGIRMSNAQGDSPSIIYKDIQIEP